MKKSYMINFRITEEVKKKLEKILKEEKVGPTEFFTKIILEKSKEK